MSDPTPGSKPPSEAEPSRTALGEAQRVANVGSWEWHVSSDTVHWSRQTYRLLGRDPGDPADPAFEAVLDALHPADREEVREQIEQASESSPIPRWNSASNTPTERFAGSNPVAPSTRRMASRCACGEPCSTSPSASFPCGGSGRSWRRARTPQIVAETVADWGVEAAQASSPSEAYERLSQEDFDLVLVD